MRLTVKYKLLLPILGTIIIGLAALQLFTQWEASEILNSRINSEVENMAVQTSNSMDMWLKSRIVDLENWSKDERFRSALSSDPIALEHCSRLLQDKDSDYDYYAGINLISPKGLVVSGSMPSSVGLNLATRDYFQRAMTGETVISPPLISKATNKPIFTMAHPVRNNAGTIIGVLSTVFKLDVATDKLTKGLVVGDTGYVFITDADGLVLAHPKSNLVMKLDLAKTEYGKDMLRQHNGFHVYQYQGEEKMMGFHQMSTNGWHVVATGTMDELTRDLVSLRTKTLLGSVVLAILVAVIILMIVSKIVSVIIAASKHLQDIAKGDVSYDAPEEFLKNTDELGQLAQSAQVLVNEQRKRAAAARSIADGDLCVTIDVSSEVDLLGNALRDMTNSLNEVMIGVNDAAAQVASGSAEVADSSQSLSQGATEQASSLEEITSSMTQLSAQTKTNAENAHEANLLSEIAKNAAIEGNEKMAHMNEAMNDISESSQAIAKIIKVIDEIAFQTNLLALNAAVEAARAGRHGKGFAVVAEEVRNLAGRSAKAAEETTQLIESSIEKVTVGSSAAQETADVLDRITNEAAKVADLLQVIAEASNEQAEGLAQIGEGLAQIDQVTQQNTASAEETASASEELSSQSSSLRQLLSRFKLTNQTTGFAPNQATRAVHVRQTKPQALPQTAPVKKNAPKGSWGAAERPKVTPQEIISLDDDEFGKY